MIDTVSLHHSESPNLRALRTEQLSQDELRGLDPDLFQAELMASFTSYFEGIHKMEGASGVPLAVAHVRRFRRLMGAFRTAFFLRRRLCAIQW